MKLFTTEDCAFCGVVKDMMDDKGIQYEVIDSIENPEEAEKYGIMGVPVLIDEDEAKHTGLHECLAKVNTIDQLQEERRTNGNCRTTTWVKNLGGSRRDS